MAMPDYRNGSVVHESNIMAMPDHKNVLCAIIILD